MKESTTMVRRLHITLGDDDFERVQAVKEELGVTWEEWALEATDALERRALGGEGGGRGEERRREVPEPDTTRADVRGDSGDSMAAESDDELAAVLEGWRPGRTPGERDARLAAAREALAFLRDRGAAEKADFLDELFPGHAPDGQNERTFWRNVVRGDLDEHTGALGCAIGAGVVEREQGPPHVYRWVGE